ncbi:MAG: NADH-quinone oxidoreductase subunit N [Candidatus Omnitrophica bacterium]|nr:NADH-quinone oxidoreductase subunit N [Candidatus Omnitrophota bacterium]
MDRTRDRSLYLMNLSLMLPELTALTVLGVLTLGEMYVKDFSQKFSARAACLGSLAVFAAVLFSWGRQGTAFGGMFGVNVFSLFFKGFFALAVIPVLQMSKEFFAPRLRFPGEFFLTLWITLIGLFVLSSARDFLLLFIALEIVTFSFYIMAAYLKRDLFSIEAGLKYLILGSLASAFMIYGISLFYVASGTTSFEGIRTAYESGQAASLITFGLILTLCASAFKAAAVPFQLWAPDVYEGAPTPVTAFLSTASKSAAFLVLIQILFGVFPAFETGRTALFSVLAALTLIYGNLAALHQTNIKRLFAYSSISHAGYLLIGLAAGGRAGLESILYYLAAYSLSTLTAFMVITTAGQLLGSDKVDAYRGLARRSPFLGAAFFIALASLTGLPPLAGFFGKFLILSAAVQQGLIFPAFLGCCAVAVSLYYYFGLIKKIYADEPSAADPLAVPAPTLVLLGISSALIIAAGFFPAPLLSLASSAAEVLF